MSFKTKSRDSFVNSSERKTSRTPIYKSICIHFDKDEYEKLRDLASSEELTLINTIKHGLTLYRSSQQS